MKPIKYLDGFSGYGGFHRGLELAGFKFSEVYYSEIDKHAIANYSYNYPNSIYAGSIDTICAGGIVKDIDLFTFGWPCQDNSIAGKRKGQRTGTRSGLLFESIKIIGHFKPRHFIAENVPGLLSVNKGIDIVESLEVLAYLNESCPQYDIEMQLLNTHWFLPQHRERLYFVGRLRGTGAGQIFPIGEGDGSFFPKGYGQDCSAGCLTQRSGSGQSNFDGSTTLIETICNINPSGRGMNGAVYHARSSAPTLSTNKGEGIKVFVPSATKSGYEEAEYGDSINMSVPGSKTRRGRVGKGTAQTLDTSCNQAVIQMGYSKGNSRAERVYSPVGASVALSSSTGGGGSPTGLYEINGSLRRLMPIECERLQGLPDDWTRFGNYSGQVKEISDTQRYKLCGNGVSVPVVEAIGGKLLEQWEHSSF